MSRLRITERYIQSVQKLQDASHELENEIREVMSRMPRMDVYLGLRGMRLNLAKFMTSVDELRDGIVGMNEERLLLHAFAESDTPQNLLPPAMTTSPALSEPRRAYVVQDESRTIVIETIIAIYYYEFSSPVADVAVASPSADVPMPSATQQQQQPIPQERTQLPISFVRNNIERQICQVLDDFSALEPYLSEDFAWYHVLQTAERFRDAYTVPFGNGLAPCPMLQVRALRRV